MDRKMTAKNDYEKGFWKTMSWCVSFNRISFLQFQLAGTVLTIALRKIRQMVIGNLNGSIISISLWILSRFFMKVYVTAKCLFRKENYANLMLLWEQPGDRYVLSPEITWTGQFVLESNLPDFFPARTETGMHLSWNSWMTITSILVNFLYPSNAYSCPYYCTYQLFGPERFSLILPTGFPFRF